MKTKSLVETLKAAQSSILNKNESSVNETPSNEKEINAICAKNATDVTKKLFSQLKTMNKSTIRDLINNPKLKHETALKAHAREKLRQEMRKQLKILSAESNSDVQLEPDMCVDSDKIPDMLIDEIEKTLEMSLFDFRDDDRNIIENNSTAEDKDIEVVKQNLGNDFFLGSEMLLMNGFSLLDSLPSDNLNKNSISDEDVKKIDLIEHQSTTSTIPVNIFNVPTPVPPPFVPTLVPPPFVLEKIVPEIERNSQPFTSIDTTCSSIIPIKTNDIIADDDWNDDLETPATSDKLIKIESRVDSFFNEPKLSTIRSEIELNVEPASSPNNDFFLNKPDRYSDCQPEPCFEEKKEEPKQTYGSYKREKHYRIDKQTSVEKMEPKKSPLDSSQFNKTPPKNNNNNNNKNNRFDKNARKYDDKRRKSRFDTPRVDNNTTSYDRNKFHINDTEKVPYTRFEPPWNNRPPIIPEKIDDGPSYRFKEKESTQDPDLEQLTSILQPKSFQFKGSFLKPSRNNNNNNNINNRPNKRPLSNTWEPERRSTSNNYSRSRSRDRTDNHDRINYNQSPSSIKETTPAQEDIRPCFNILKKVQEIDSEITKVHEKLHGIDKVIMNLQTEKIGIQKSFSRLQNERKILFESLMKKATAANNLTIENKTEVKSTAVKPVPSTNKTQINKKLQDIVDRKRKNDHTDIKQDELKKRKAIDVVTTSAEQSCTKIVPVEKTATVSHILDNEDPKVTERNKAKKVQNIQKHHPQDNVDGKLKSTKVNPTRCNEIVKSLDNKVNNVNDNDSAIKYKIIVSKPTSQKKSPKLIKRRSITPKQLFIKEDIIDVDNYVIKNLNVMLSKLPSNLAFNVDIDVDVMEAIKVEPLTDELVPCSNLNETLSFDNELEFVQKQEQLDYVEAMNDRPLTPGSDFIFNDQILDTNYLEWTGNFESHTKPITHLMSVQNQFLICASEDGKIYKYSITDGTLLGLFTKHTDICNYFIFDGSHICSVSSDGFVHRIKLDVS